MSSPFILKSPDSSLLWNIERQAFSSSLPPRFNAVAGPVFALYLSWLLMALISMVDLLLAGRIDKNAQAAIGIADQILFLTMLAMSGLSAGINAHMSQALGAGDSKGVNAYKQAGQVITVLFGVLATAGGSLWSEPVARFFCANEDIVQQASRYMSICSLANLPWALIQSQGAMFRALGHARLVALQWLLIASVAIGPGSLAFLFWPGTRSLVPLAVAWILASLIGFFFGQIMLSRFALKTGEGSNRIEETLRRMGDIFKVAMPMLVSELSWLVSNLLLYGLMAKLPDGATAQTAWTIKLRVEEIVAMAPLLAAGMCVATSVGHRFGAGKPQAARALAQRLAAQSTTIMLIAGCLTAFFAPYAVPYLTQDEQAGRLSKTLLASTALTFPLMALSSLLAAAFEGTGRTLPPMVINFIAFFLLRLPLAWGLTAWFKLGMLGIIIAKTASCLFAAYAMVFIFQRNFGFKKTKQMSSSSHMRLDTSAYGEIESR